jgi:hypothetical protein
VQSACVSAADGVTEREAEQLLLEASGRRRGTVGAEKPDNVARFVAAVRALGPTPRRRQGRNQRD